MDRLVAPAVPEGFTRKVKPLEENLRKVLGGAAERSAGVEIEGPWGDYKDRLSAAQHGKCAYCDARVTGNQYGDVDHYRPKGAVSVLDEDEETHGRQVPNKSVVKDRRPIPLDHPGYWWDAFDWGNYLLSCKICNRTYKKTIFPVSDEAKRARRPEEEPGESPLLLHPFQGPDPAEHLKFREDGNVEPLDDSDHGRATIQTLGLNRDGLALDREDKAIRAYTLVDRLALAEGAEADRLLRDFCKLGDPRTPFSGTVRAIFEQYIDCSWEMLLELFGD